MLTVISTPLTFLYIFFSSFDFFFIRNKHFATGLTYDVRFLFVHRFLQLFIYVFFLLQHFFVVVNIVAGYFRVCCYYCCYCFNPTPLNIQKKDKNPFLILMYHILLCFCYFRRVFFLLTF